MDTDRLVVWSRVSASWFVVIGCLLLLSLTVACGLENEGSDAGPQDETGGGQQPPVSVEDEVGSGEEQYDPEPDPAEGSGVTGNAEQTAESPGFGEITSVEDAQAATLRIETRGIATSPGKTSSK